jgi:uncharacterized protein YciW
MHDLIDTAAGLSEGSATYTLRRTRPEIVRLSQSSFEAALRPRDVGGMDHAERAALAARMARQCGDSRLAAAYADLLDKASPAPGVAALADPALPPPVDGRLAAIVRLVDLLTLTPEAARAGDIGLLRAAGLTDRDVVTLCGLVAFVNYQVRVAAGLRLLAGRA